MMSMPHLKTLYIGKSLEDLSQFYSLPDLKHSKVQSLCNTSQKIYVEAEKSLREGDEERSFILFMKYLNIINLIRSNPGYAKDKPFINQLLGTNSKQMKAIDNAEIISNSLKRRYDELKQQEDALKKLEEYEEQNKYREKINSDIERSKLTDAPALQKTSITCKELYNMILDNKGLLILDCRPKSDFLESKLHFRYCLNIPEEILNTIISAGRIQGTLSPDEKMLWSSRGIKDYVILIDWNTEGPEPCRDTPIWTLKEILNNWDQDAKYKSILLLEGGYENVLLFYPTLTTNAYVKPPQYETTMSNMLDEIEYPLFSDIIMKDDDTFNMQQSSTTTLKPLINRKTKYAALRKYDESEQNIITDILDEKEKLADKTLNVEKEFLEAETNWNSFESQAEKATDDERSKLLQRQQELIYNMLQLDNKKRDYEAEHNVLRDKIKEISEIEKDEDEDQIISTKAAEELEEEAAKREQIKLKEEEIKKLTEERVRLAREREKKLEIAREQKRQSIDIIDDEGISKAKIPVFDRNVKPTTKISQLYNTRIERDFSPVKASTIRGLTGLKNLGNTCYMNSIIQCLSNTVCLVDYFIDGTYRKHINESSRTQGRIVEEMVAVVSALWCGQYKLIASKDLRYFIGQYQQTFRGSEQQDSHEFLTILMDWLHLDLQTIIVKSPRDNLSSSEKAWLDFTKSKESFILRFFYGQIKSTVKCIQCSKESATYESFSNLSLELPQNSSRCEIKNCLDMYFHGEKISGWNCPNCKKKRDAVKKLDISRLPPILVIHFKRFYADPDSITNSYKKKQNFIQFPLSELDIEPYIARSELRSSGIRRKRLYNLYGISNHYGTMEMGHYTAFCKSSACGRWFKFDDHIVSPLDTSDVRSSAAYILFYTSITDSPEYRI